MGLVLCFAFGVLVGVSFGFGDRRAAARDERERCARIAEGMRDRNRARPAGTPDAPAADIANWIAARIRDGA